MSEVELNKVHGVLSSKSLLEVIEKLTLNKQLQALFSKPGLAKKGSEVSLFILFYKVPIK
jgi:hypothetical protein